MNAPRTQQGRVQEFTLRTISGDDSSIVSVLRDVAASSTGHQDLYAGLFIFFEQ